MSCTGADVGSGGVNEDDNMLQLTIKDLSGDSFVITKDGESTVRSVKVEIEKSRGDAVSTITLFTEGSEHLLDRTKLKELTSHMLLLTIGSHVSSTALGVLLQACPDGADLSMLDTCAETIRSRELKRPPSTLLTFCTAFLIQPKRCKPALGTLRVCC
jgi:hypothetical protein